MTNLSKALVLVAVLVLSLVAVTSARAATSLSFASQSWHVFKATGRLGQVWSPTMVSVSAGTLTEKISGNTAGGVGSTHWQTYGTYSADFKISAGVGKGVLLLKGHEGTPFNELDFAETSKGDSGRTAITATRHWGIGKANMMQHRISGNFTQWHTVKVVWTSAAMTVYMNGVQFARYTTHISRTPMDLAVQTAGANVAGAGAPASLQVRNLVIS
jgi:beta-glucanase (GH16 family)